MPWLEEILSAVETALAGTYGESALLVGTDLDHAIVRVAEPAPDEDARYVRVPFYWDATGALVLRDPEDVPDAVQLSDVISLMYALPGASGSAPGGKAPPAFVQKMPTQKQHQWVDIWNRSYDACTKAGKSAATCEASAFAQANGVVKADDTLVLPATGTGLLTGQQYEVGVPLSDILLSDDSQLDASVYFALRLADTAAVLPVWQPYHVIGKWTVPHGLAGPIRFTKEIGDHIIRNFKAGVLRRGVPLDERHLFEQNGIAHAWAEDFRWGKDGEGLPGAPEPSGNGPILYARWNYLDTAPSLLTLQENGHAPYEHFSPQYTLDYCDKKTGTCYGPTALAGAMTNDGFIRDLRSLQGKPAWPWVNPASIAASDVTVVYDGLRPYQAQEDPAMTTPQQPPAQPPTTTPVTSPPPPVHPPTQSPPPQPGPPPNSLSDSIALAEQVRTLQLQITEANARAARAEELANENRQTAEAERRVGYLKGVVSLEDSLIRGGTPAGPVKILARVLQLLKADSPKLVTLSDTATAPDATIPEAIEAAMRAIPTIDLQRHTRPNLQRPEDVQLDDVVYTAEQDYGRQMAAELARERGLTPLTTPAPAGTNGTGH